MRREGLLTAGIAVLLTISAIAVVAVPGVVADRDPDDLLPGRVSIHEATIAADSVSDGTVTLSVTAYLNHRGGTSENVSLQVRAIDLESGLVQTTREVGVAPISGDREQPVTVNVSVPRDGGYRIEAVLYKDDQRVDAVAKAVRGVGTVQTGGQVTFHRFAADLPSVQYSVADAGPNRTELDVSTYLTNSGAEPSGPVTVEVIVRQAESNIVAARTSVAVEEIGAGETVTPSATVTVPSGYNYYLDAILRKDGTIVDTSRSAANLDPQERIDVDTTVRGVGLEVEDFERTTPQERPRETQAAETSGGGVPGFDPVIAVIALIVSTLLAWRYTYE